MADWSSNVRGTLNVGVGIATMPPPPLTVPAKSVTVTADDNPALFAAALLITVMLLSMAYEIANPPRTDVLPALSPLLNGSQAKLKFGAQLFKSLARIGRVLPGLLSQTSHSDR